MRRVLIGIDDSEYSRASVDLGLRWAARHNLMLFGLGIVDVPELTRPEPVPLGAGVFKSQKDQQAVGDAHRKVEQLLQQFSVRCAEAGVASKVLENEGNPVQQIAREANRVDLIILGQRTNFDLAGEALATEVLPEIVKHCPRPVVAVPAKPAEGESVVVAYDGSLQAARALQMFQLSRLAGGNSVHLVSVAADRAQAVRLADQASEFLGSHEIKVVPHAFASTSAAETILEQVGALNAGLLVMGAYGQNSIREFFFGSVTRTILAQAPVPTFLYS